MKNKKTTTILALLLILATTATAARVGVAIEYPNGTVHTECVQVSDGTDGYNTLEETSLQIIWSHHQLWGHGLCAIEDVGCPADNCYCKSDYWAFLLAEKGDNNWNYMPVGFDAGDECWNHDYNSYTGHYCARDGDVIALAYGPWGTQPSFVKFTDICGPTRRSSRASRNMETQIEGDTAKAGEPATLTVRDENTGDAIKGVEVGVYEGVPGASAKVFEGETNNEGEISFTIEEAGDYRIRLSKSRYPHEYMELKVVAGKTETPPETTPSTTPETTIQATTTPSTLASTTSTAAAEPTPQTTTAEATTSTIKLIPPPESKWTRGETLNPPTGMLITPVWHAKKTSPWISVMVIISLIAITACLIKTQ